MVRLSVSSSERLDEEVLSKKTRDLCNMLDQEENITAKLEELPGPKGSKGEPVGMILLTLVNAGVATALFNVVKAYLERDQTVKISVELPDSATLTVESKNLSRDQIEKLVQQALRPLGGCRA